MGEYLSCFARWFALTAFLMAMHDLLVHPDVPGAVCYFIDLVCAVLYWRDYILRTYRYNLQIECNDGTIIEKKFLSLAQRQRMVGALVEAGGWKLGEK